MYEGISDHRPVKDSELNLCYSPEISPRDITRGTRHLIVLPVRALSVVKLPFMILICENRGPEPGYDRYNSRLIPVLVYETVLVPLRMMFLPLIYNKKVFLL